MEKIKFFSLLVIAVSMIYMFIAKKEYKFSHYPFYFKILVYLFYGYVAVVLIIQFTPLNKSLFDPFLWDLFLLIAAGLMVLKAMLSFLKK